MADQIEESGSASTKPAKDRPVKTLPTDRVSFEKQLSILRAYAAASGPEKKAVSNSDVGKIVGIHPGSISNCNPFFADIGLLSRDGMQYRPTEDAFSYSSSYQWDPEKAAHKLAPTLRGSWFAQTLVPKLSFRSFSKDEAVTFLAEEAKAAPEYRLQLEALLDYLRVAGVIAVEGNMVAAAAGARGNSTGAPPKVEPDQPKVKAADHQLDPNLKEFSIPIPGKASARITFPRGLEAEDWDMLKSMLDAYIRRLRKEGAGGGGHG